LDRVHPCGQEKAGAVVLTTVAPAKSLQEAKRRKGSTVVTLGSVAVANADHEFATGVLVVEVVLALAVDPALVILVGSG
jgi:hypothetical protein